ncbi:MAG: pyrimidine/purine nucleoside phosphorylase [Akkermansiaceae bacterium]|jgi:hypothetical protein
MTFENVTATALANVYFDGKVISHSLAKANGQKVTRDGSEEAQSFQAGTHFEVPANSGFTIAVAGGICQYVCTFLS